MGEAAAKEPTMEDILSSIRKIIAEEGDTQPAGAVVEDTAAAPAEVPVKDDSAVMQLPDEEPAVPSLAAIREDMAQTTASTPELQELQDDSDEDEAAPPVAGSLAAIASQMYAAGGAQSGEDVAGTVENDMAENGFAEPLAAVADSGFEPQAEAAPVEETPVDGGERIVSRSLADIAASAKSMSEPALQAVEVADSADETNVPVAEAALTQEQAAMETAGETVGSPSIAMPEENAMPTQDTIDTAPAQQSLASIASAMQGTPAPTPPVTHVEMADAEPAAEASPPVEATQASTMMPTPPAEVDDAAFKGALMSPSSDGAVSGSFDRLKRSVMDDLEAQTEAILRPMLREWLDENLPNMVERMVREEIERVARG